MKFLHFVIITLLIIPFIGNAAEPLERHQVRIFNSETQEVISSFEPFTNTIPHAIDLAVGDLEGIATDEIIVSALKDYDPVVKIFDSNGTLLHEFLAYTPHYKGGVAVTVVDVDTNGTLDIITAPQRGGGPHIRVFDPQGNEQYGFFAFDTALRGGAHIAAGDLTPMHGQEIVAASGFNMDSVVRVFNRYGDVLYEFDPGYSITDYGIQVAVGDVDNDGINEIITGGQAGSAPEIKIFTPDGMLKQVFFAYNPGFRGGVNLSVGTIGINTEHLILTGAGFSGSAHVRFMAYDGTPRITPTFFAFDAFKGGVIPESGNFTSTPGKELVIATQFISPTKRYDHYQIINVDLSQQKLTTFEFGKQRDTSLISSGLLRFPTPVGVFKVQRKIFSKTYEWSYGPEHPDNYELHDVKYNLMFKWPFYLHGAYWHNNFGNRMSHGCINLPLPYAEKLYNWAHVGAKVVIHDGTYISTD